MTMTKSVRGGCVRRQVGKGGARLTDGVSTLHCHQLHFAEASLPLLETGQKHCFALFKAV